MNKKETKLKKAIEWFQNKRVFVVIILAFTVYISISKVLETTKKNIEIINPPKPEVSVLDSMLRVTARITSAEKDPIEGVSVTMNNHTMVLDNSDSEGAIFCSFAPEREVVTLTFSHEDYEPYVKKIRTAMDTIIDLKTISMKRKVDPQLEKNTPNIPKSRPSNQADVSHSSNTTVIQGTGGDVTINK